MIQKWEYMIIYDKSQHLGSALMSAGAEGWEAVSVNLTQDHIGQYTHVVLKRPISKTLLD